MCLRDAVRSALWCTYGIPILGVIIFIMGYIPLIGSWLG